MKTKSLACVALLTFSAHAWAEKPLQTVSGSIWRDGATRAVFELRVGPGETQHAPLHDGESLEVSRSKAGTLVRVLDAAGAQVASAALGTDTTDKSIRFAFCADGGVEIVVPVPASAPRCRVG